MSTTLVHLFFFSSRRRHTRFDCDWSSDVCSSDLAGVGEAGHQIREALPIELLAHVREKENLAGGARQARIQRGDRKSTRLNSSHSQISYAVFCLKKKKTKPQPQAVNNQQ